MWWESEKATDEYHELITLNTVTENLFSIIKVWPPENVMSSTAYVKKLYKALVFPERAVWSLITAGSEEYKFENEKKLLKELSL